MTDIDPRLTPKELAAILKRNVSFVYAMKRRGFVMPAGRTTLQRAEVWLVRNPAPRRRK